MFKLGVPVKAQWKWIWLVSMRTQVWSLASLSGLRIWHCRELWCRSQMRLRSCVSVALASASGCSSDSTPVWELPYAMGAAPKRQSSKQCGKCATQSLLSWINIFTNHIFSLNISYKSKIEVPVVAQVRDLTLSLMGMLVWSLASLIGLGI